MFHYVNAIQDTKGNALIGYFVKAVSPADGSVVSIYADESATPISSVSGVENAAEVDSDGNASFYIADGEYHIDIYATDQTTFVKRIEDIPMAKIGMLKAATKGDVADADTAYPVILTLDDEEGIFSFKSDDLSEEVAADGDQTTYIAPSSDDTGASGAWKRITGGTLSIPLPDGVLTGCAVVYDADLTFNMSAGSYVLGGILYNVDDQSVTLDDGDASNPRIDVIYVDNTGTLGVVAGDPAATPSEPALDPTTQLRLSFVLVPSGATTLDGITLENIYLDADGWTATASNAAIVIDSTNNPFEGTKCVEATNPPSAHYAKFVRSSALSFDGDGNLSLRIRAKAGWTGSTRILIHWLAAGVLKGAASFRNGQRGFVSSNTSDYQLVSIPKSDFAVPAGTNVDELRVRIYNATSSGFYLDKIILQTDGETVGSPTFSTFTQEQADARYLKQTGGTLSGDLSVPAEAYGSGWNGSNEVPTKNDVYDKIETVIAGAGTGDMLGSNNLSDVDSVSTARTNLGLGTGDSPQFTAINLGAASDTTLSRTGAGDIAVEGNAVYRAGGTDVPVTDGGTGSSTASGARTNLGLGTVAILDETTTAQYRANTADKALSTDQVWGAADYVALTPGTNVAVDMSGGFNFSLAMGGNYTLDNPSNTKNGQTGCIVITQDGTGSRTLAYGSNWKFAGGTDPTLTTTASAVDVLFYQVISSTSIFANLVKAIA